MEMVSAVTDRHIFLFLWHAIVDNSFRLVIIYYSLTAASDKVQHANGNGSSVMLPEVSGQSVFACFV